MLYRLILEGKYIRDYPQGVVKKPLVVVEITGSENSPVCAKRSFMVTLKYQM